MEEIEIIEVPELDPSLRRYDIVCMGGDCLEVLGEIILPADHPRPDLATSGYLCEGCTPAYRAELFDLNTAEEEKRAALDAMIEEYMAGRKA